jgi:CheY-like chemotaxis protein
MGGHIGATSAPGVGSTFFVELQPAEAAHRQECAPSAVEAVQLPDSPFQVLYVEDNSSNTLLVERILGGWPSVELITTPHGSDALSLAVDRRPDLILLDLNLPDMDGEVVLKNLQLEAATAGIPVLVISADATQRQIKRVLSAGARGYLTKPLDVVHFQQVVGGLLREPLELAIEEAL